MTWKEIEKLHHKEDRGSYVRSESGTYDIIEAVNKLIDSHNTDSKSDYEKKQDGTWCDFCGKMHTGQCKKGDIDSDRKCCNQCRGGWSEIGNQFGCLKVDCSCHSVPAEKCSCLEDNKLSQALCKVHGKNNSDRVDIAWKERFVEKGADIEHDRWARWQKYMFSKGVVDSDGVFHLPKEFVDRWFRQVDTPYSELSEPEKESDRKETRNYLPLVQSERELLLKELIDEIEKMRKDFFVFDDERKVISCVSHNSALKEIQELIRKKM